MGGKNAIIVDADADLDEAIVHILHSAFGYQGQKCSACSRLIVLEENYDRLVERLQAAAESLHLGPVEDPQNFFGAVIDQAARQKILDYIAIGKEEGTVLLQRDMLHPALSTRHAALRSFCVPLTIFTDIRPEHRLAQEEIFGPGARRHEGEDFEEALRWPTAPNTP